MAQPDVGIPPLGHAVRIQPTSTDKQVVAYVYTGRYSWVRIETRESGAALNQHPVVVAPANLRAVLEQVQWVDTPSEPLFSSKQLDEITAPVAAALGRASAEQDVSFAVSDQFGFLGPLASRAVTTARVFLRDGELQLIVGLARRDFESQFRGTGTLIAFEPGQRAQPVDRQVKLAVAAGAGQPAACRLGRPRHERRRGGSLARFPSSCGRGAEQGAGRIGGAIGCTGCGRCQGRRGDLPRCR